MTEQRFWGVKAAMDDGGGGFDYGREIIRQADYDRLLERRRLPYEIFPLFLPNNWKSYAQGGDLITIAVSGIMRSGFLS